MQKATEHLLYYEEGQYEVKLNRRKPPRGKKSLPLQKSEWVHRDLQKLHIRAKDGKQCIPLFRGTDTMYPFRKLLFRNGSKNSMHHTKDQLFNTTYKLYN